MLPIFAFYGKRKEVRDNFSVLESRKIFCHKKAGVGAMTENDKLDILYKYQEICYKRK